MVTLALSAGKVVLALGSAVAGAAVASHPEVRARIDELKGNVRNGVDELRNRIAGQTQPAATDSPDGNTPAAS